MAVDGTKFLASHWMLPDEVQWQSRRQHVQKLHHVVRHRPTGQVYHEDEGAVAADEGPKWHLDAINWRWE
ncbi:hypothetical protein A0H81_12295 [Grifola frondosa]|uniref:Uncharacterized protein n=1 Tax=Grifola frondosa TaxID=5627 RepID=A0A1C7LTB3_GRIFR|nr:hypothetical protein A0H81_12295 [Grifola frondosa]